VLPYLDVTCVLDVGAGTGEFGAFLRQNGYSGHIVSFEPVEASFRVLASRCERDPWWDAYQYALGSETTLHAMNVMRSRAYSSFLKPSAHSVKTFPGSRVERTEIVDVRRLDEIFDDVVPPKAEASMYLKLTTQGWDAPVLRGAEGCLDRIRAVQTELCLDPLYDDAPGLSEMLASLNDLGFVVSGLFDRPHHHDFRLAEIDCVAIKPARPAPHVVRRW
jgi:FkbM family methyltransferase